MTVYVLTRTWQCDCGDFGNDVMVFDTIEKATNELQKEIKNARQDFKDLDTEEDNYIDGNMSWSIWEKEEYAYNHIDLVIYEKEIQ